jgi:DNA mismatch repair protein MutS2
LNYGSPGSSLALEISSRLGMPPEVIEKARAHRTAREAQLAEHLARIDKDMQALEHERRLAARERETLAEATAKLHSREQDLRHKEETFRRRLDEKIEERLREARREIDTVVDALKARTGRLIPTGETGGARAEARAAIDAIGDRLRESQVQPQPAPASRPVEPGRPIAVGDRVLVGGLGLEGIVQGLHDREAEVDVRGKRLRARLAELRLVASAQAAPQPARVRVTVDLQPREGSLTELNVIGCNVDEALTRVGKFLDEAMVSDAKTLRIVHGYGTGQLRRAVGDFLRTHPIVAQVSTAPDNQGGGGATIVELKE